MKWWKVSVGVFLLVGVVIAFFSLYKASVDGLMKQLGLVGSDFSVSVVRDKLATINDQAKTTLRCDLPTRLRGSVKFFMASDQEQGEQAFYLGQERIKCGAAMLSMGDVEVGTYEIVKGIGYLKQGYNFVRERVGVDERVCKNLPQQELDSNIQLIFEATSGKVYEIIWDEWQGMTKVRKVVEEACL